VLPLLSWPDLLKAQALMSLSERIKNITQQTHLGLSSLLLYSSLSTSSSSRGFTSCIRAVIREHGAVRSSQQQ
jgi:hypothetical protein